MVPALFAAAAATGALARWWGSTVLNRPGRPYGTFAVNMISCFALAVLAGSPADTMVVAGIGGLGSLSTFSTVMREVASMLDAGRRGDAWIYSVGTVAAGVAVASWGLSLS